MKFSELKKLVPPADPGKSMPGIQQLIESGASVVAIDSYGTMQDVLVYDNGYVLYRNGKASTVFRLHSCRDYVYVVNGEVRDVIKEEAFDLCPWSRRLFLEGEDRLEHNAYVNWCRTTVSYDGVAEDWGALADHTYDGEIMLMTKEACEEEIRKLYRYLNELSLVQRQAVIQCCLLGKRIRKPVPFTE